jgi:hypothetical protein
MARSKSATSRLEAAQAGLDDTHRKLAELNTRRNECLLKDNDAEAAELAAEIEKLARLVAGHRDKIALLKQAAAEQEQARKVKEKAALIERIEKNLLADRDAAGAELSDAIQKADAAFRKMVDAGQAIMAAWPWQPHDTHAVLLTPTSVVQVTAHELYKIGARPRRYGGMDKPGDGLDFPGGRCPDIRLANLQEEIKSLPAVCAEASALASSIMRTGRSTSYVEPVAVSSNGQGEPRQRTEAEQRLFDLNSQLVKLGEDITPAGEQKYQRVVSEIAIVQTEIDAARKMERQQ